jgi:hypothetical protein
MVQVSLGKKQDPISKITRAKKAGGVAQAVEHLPSKCKTLSSKPSIAKTFFFNLRGGNSQFVSLFENV